jgi:hypothetical protein
MDERQTYKELQKLCRELREWKVHSVLEVDIICETAAKLLERCHLVPDCGGIATEMREAGELHDIRRSDSHRCQPKLRY